MPITQYAIKWSTIDGGGGTSTGSVYSASGTSGQPGAGPTMSNGQYSVAGGFRALPQAVQTEGALFQPPPAARSTGSMARSISAAASTISAR